MSLIEKFLDRVTPKLEVVEEICKNYDTLEFPENLILTIQQNNFDIIERSDKELLILVRGRTLGSVDFNSILRNNPSFEKMNKIKSRIRIFVSGGSLWCSSYEHIIATKQEKEVFTKILKKRMDLICGIIKDSDSSPDE